MCSQRGPGQAPAMRFTVSEERLSEVARFYPQFHREDVRRVLCAPALPCPGVAGVDRRGAGTAGGGLRGGDAVGRRRGDDGARRMEWVTTQSSSEGLSSRILARLSRVSRWNSQWHGRHFEQL
jgi:hypothetical protein